MTWSTVDRARTMHHLRKLELLLLWLRAWYNLWYKRSCSYQAPSFVLTFLFIWLSGWYDMGYEPFTCTMRCHGKWDFLLDLASVRYNLGYERSHSFLAPSIALVVVGFSFLFWYDHRYDLVGHTVRCRLPCFL